jgi:hypothetical protein
MIWLLYTAVWWGTAASLIALDSSMRKKKRDVDPEHPDLSDKSVAPWLIVALVAGSFTFPFYLYSTRKTVVAAVIGVVLIPVFLVVVRLLTGYLAIGLGTVLG